MWTGQSFHHHNGGLSPAQSAHAAAIANHVLASTGDEGEAVATGNKLAANHRASGAGMVPRGAARGGLLAVSQPTHTMMPHLGSAGIHAPHIGLAPISQRHTFHLSSMMPRRDDGGAVSMAPTPGLQPNVQTANPLQQSYIQRFASMSPEQLQELVARLGGSPLAAIAQHVLQQKRMMPAAPAPTQTAQSTPLSPAPSTQQPASFMQPAQQQGAARGGGTQQPRDTVPILAAGGEFIIAPHHVARFGDGDIKEGHRRLDQFVVEARRHIIETTKKLKGPVKS